MKLIITTEVNGIVRTSVVKLRGLRTENEF